MDLVYSLCGLWSHLFSMALQSSPDSIPWKSLCALAFSTRAVDRLWVVLNTKDSTYGTLQQYLDSFNVGKDFKHTGKFGVATVLCSLLPPVLIASDDSEIFDEGRPLPLHQFVRFIRFYKILLFKIIQKDAYVLMEPNFSNAKADSNDTTNATEYSSQLFRFGSVKAIAATLADLYARWARKPFSPSSLWEVESADSSAIKRELREQTPFAVTMFRIMPWAIDFHERMKLFREIVEASRISIQGRDDVNSGQRSKGTVVKVRRRYASIIIINNS